MPIFFPDTPVVPGEPGEFVDLPYEYQFKDLVFGHATDFVTEEVTGLLSTAPTRDQDQDRTNDHGSTPGILLYGKRIIQFDMKIKGTAGLDIEAKLRTARRVFQAPRRRHSLILQEFVFQRPGEPRKVCFVRCTKRDFPSNFKTARGLAVGSVELVAPDPRIYSLEVHSVDVSHASGEITKTGVVYMDGDFEDGADPIVTFDGPANNPTLTNLEDDERQFKLNTILGPADHVQVDFKTRIIRKSIDDGPWEEDLDLLAEDSRWWVLLPGENHVSFNRGVAPNNDTSANATIDWRDTYQ